MGLQVSHWIGPSDVHGTGLFAAESVAEGSLLWCYEPGLERRLCLNELEPDARSTALHYGYVNPLVPSLVVVCGDDARFWNFPPVGSPANAVPSVELLHGEALIIAARDIAAGEELLIDPSSDADYFRKLSVVAPQLMSDPWLPRAS